MARILLLVAVLLLSSCSFLERTSDLVQDFRQQETESVNTSQHTFNIGWILAGVLIAIALLVSSCAYLPKLTKPKVEEAHEVKVPIADEELRE